MSLGATIGAGRLHDILDAFAFEQLTIPATAGGTGLTASVYNTEPPAQAMLVSTEGIVTFTLDGTAPVTGTTGHLTANGDHIFITGLNNIRHFLAIGANIKIDVSYFR